MLSEAYAVITVYQLITSVKGSAIRLWVNKWKRLRDFYSHINALRRVPLVVHVTKQVLSLRLVRSAIVKGIGMDSNAKGRKKARWRRDETSLMRRPTELCIVDPSVLLSIATVEQTTKKNFSSEQFSQASPDNDGKRQSKARTWAPREMFRFTRPNMPNTWNLISLRFFAFFSLEESKILLFGS